MKTLQCDVCKYEARGETFEDWMNALKPHYSEAHANFMKQQSERSEEDQKAEMKKWEIENRARFDAQSEDK
jgi:hypothetical protein